MDLTGLGVGVVIGTGIFTLTGIEAKNHAGPAVVISFLIAGVVALLAGLCYAELASGVPTAGSAYSYAYVGIGELVAWIIGWDMVLEFALGAAVVARGWSGYLQNLFSLPPSLVGETATVNLGAMAITLGLGVIAALGIRESARVTNALVIIKVAICLFIIIIAGAFFVKLSNWSPFVPESAGPASAEQGAERTLAQAVFGLPPEAFGIGGIFTAAAVVFFAYSGFEAVANMGEETRKPSRDLPLGLLGTLAIATALYIGVAAVVTGMVSYGQRDHRGSPPGPGPDPGRLLGQAGHRHRGDLTHAQQPGQMDRVLGVGLDPITSGTLQLRRRSHHTPDPRLGQRPIQPEPGRAGLIRHRHRTRQLLDPRSDLIMRRCQPRLHQLTGHTIDRRQPLTGHAHPNQHSYAQQPPGPRIGRAGASCPTTHDDCVSEAPARNHSTQSGHSIPSRRASTRVAAWPSIRSGRIAADDLRQGSPRWLRHCR